MKRIIIPVLFIFLTFQSFGQNVPGKNHENSKLECKTCHNCEVPTKNNPCLNPCPRDKMIAINPSADQGPEVIVLNKLENKYVPVVFSHKLHAQMSEMSGGCKGCHHYNTLGPILPCENCHETNRKRDDITKPDLKGALHRQCMDCHREWSHSTNCTSCHELKKPGMDINWKAEVQNIEGKDHPFVEVPTKIVYETKSDEGKYVTFYHDQHNKLFNIDCKSCHQNENCTKCHDVKKVSIAEQTALDNPVKVSRLVEDQHKPCFKCHEDDSCDKCHMDKVSGPFNHKEVTGWALNKFHEKLSCEKCHGTSSKFVKLNNNCSSCHSNWTMDNFNHKVTGVELDDIHKEASCEDCHIDKKFDNKPSCTNCHDEKSFPKNVPGKIFKN